MNVCVCVLVCVFVCMCVCCQVSAFICVLKTCIQRRFYIHLIKHLYKHQCIKCVETIRYSRGQQPFQHAVPVLHFLGNECALSNHILKIKLNHDTATKNISRRPGIVLFPCSPQSCINILNTFLVVIFTTRVYKL